LPLNSATPNERHFPSEDTAARTYTTTESWFDSDPQFINTGTLPTAYRWAKAKHPALPLHYWIMSRSKLGDGLTRTRNRLSQQWNHDVSLIIREISGHDRPQWQLLWDSYNAFYGRSGPTALDPAITEITWERFFNPREPVNALVAVESDRIVGLVHYLYHRSTTREKHVCYLQDLFTQESLRGKGIGRRLIEAVVVAARRAGSDRVYWQTKADNHAGRLLYDKVATHTGFIVYVKELSIPSKE
jgi:GNAT superfamily N-acetyltransferase